MTTDNPWGIELHIPENITVGDLMDFAQLKKMADMQTYMTEKLGLSPAEFRKIPLKQIRAFMEFVGEELKGMMDVPKES